MTLYLTREEYLAAHPPRQGALPEPPVPPPPPSDGPRLSAYQTAILDWIDTGRGDAIVNAVAGSGKTTTIVMAAQRVRGSGLFLAFNKHIAEELTRRLPPHMPAATIHSIGYRTLNGPIRRRPQLDDRKYWRLIRQYLDDQDPQARFDDDAKDQQRDDASALAALIDKTRVTLTDPHDHTALAELAYRFGIPIDPALLPAVAAILDRGDAAARAGVIDYTDMIYLPHRWRLWPRPVDWVFVDEAQDLSAAQLDLVLKLRAPGGRCLFVGDRQQAIMGFAGADAASYQAIIDRTNATPLPLSICYRCPTSHLELARLIVPQIESAPDAPAGRVESIREEELPATVREGDLIMCRLTAPLVSLCIRLIGAKVPARVRGRDIARTLTSTVRDIADQRGFCWDSFDDYAMTYHSRILDRLTRRQASEEAISAANDRLEAILAVVDAYSATSVDSLCQAIDSLFADDRASVWLSTVHRAKGLEAPRTFILYPEKLPLIRRNQQPWELEQEQNLRYVALTRSAYSHANPESADAGVLYLVPGKAKS